MTMITEVLRWISDDPEGRSRLLRWVPWRVLYWIDRRYPTCWSSLCSAKFGSEQASIRPTWMCWSGQKGREYDYCGKYHTHEEFERART